MDRERDGPARADARERPRRPRVVEAVRVDDVRSERGEPSFERVGLGVLPRGVVRDLVAVLARERGELERVRRRAAAFSLVQDREAHGPPPVTPGAA